MIDRHDNARVEIYLGEKNRQIRVALIAALQDLKLAVRSDFVACEPLSDAVRDGNVDMVIVDAGLPGGDARGLINAIRHDKLGPNPFISVIATTWDSSPKGIRTLIDSGVDGLLAKPISISAIRMQIDAIINRRKPFVVTSRYIGPDRRKDPTRQSNTPLIDVPNTLRSKVKGIPIDPVQLRRDIASARQIVMSERLRRNAFELSFTVKLIMAEDSGEVSIVDRHLRRIQAVIKDTIERIDNTPFAHTVEFCRSLLRLVETIAANHPDHSSRDFALLKPLSDAILLSFNPERSAADLAHETAEAIARFAARKDRVAGAAADGA